MNAIDVTKYPEVPLGADGKPWSPDRDPPEEIVRAADGRLYKRMLVYWTYVPPLEVPGRASPLLVHALRKEWWSAWWHEEIERPHTRKPVDAARIAGFADQLGDTAGNDERLAWEVVNLELRAMLVPLCVLAVLAKEAETIRELLPLTARNFKAAVRIFRSVGRVMDRLSPWTPAADREPLSPAAEILDAAESRSGLIALSVALIGCDVEGERDGGDWPRVRRVCDSTNPITDGAIWGAYRVASKAVTMEQAERFSRDLTAAVEEFFRNLPRASARGARRSIRRAA